MCTSMRQTQPNQMYPCYIERMWTCNIFMQDRKRVFFPILYMLLRVFFFLFLLLLSFARFSRMLLQCKRKERTHQRATYTLNKFSSRQVLLYFSCCAFFLARWTIYSATFRLLQDTSIFLSFFFFKNGAFFFIFIHYILALYVMWCKLSGVMVRLHWIDLTSATLNALHI